MTLTPGTRFGSYEIVSKLGEGSMGEVFRARDTKLGRDVAAKVMPASFAQDASRLARFEREARTLASLNHPNVAQVFGLEDGATGGEGTGHGPVLVMELLDGHALTDLLAGGPLPVRKAVDYAGQIARGLAAAHERGIIHRDLKPDNLFVLPDGRVKILDFGLARQIEPVSADPSDPDATRMHDLRTEPGMVMGTVGYMAPEQVRAELTDARSDLFSLGLVLYEMLTGQRAFRRGTMAETMTAILREDPPDLAGLRPEASPGLVRVVQRLLEKSPNARFQTGSDLAFALEHLSGSAPGSGVATATPSPSPVPPAPDAERERRKNRSPLRTFGWVALGLVIAASSVVFSGLMPDDEDEAAVATAPPVYRASVVFPEGVKLTELGAPAFHLAMSPDGTKVAFIGAARGEQRPPDRIWILTLADGSVRELDGSIGARGPFWSPDSQQLGFFDTIAGVTKRIALSGGQATTIAPFRAGGAWAPDGTILLVEEPPGTRIATTTAASATPPDVALTGTDGKVVGFPAFLDDYKRFLFSMAESRTGPVGIYLGTRGGSAASAPKVIDREDALNTRLANGYVLFTDGPMLLAQRFDQASGTVSGPVATLADDVTYTLKAGAAFSASDTGVLVYSPKPFQSNSRLVWMDRAGRPVSTLADAADYSNLVLSPDGRRAVTSVMDPVRRTRDIYIVDIERGVRQRLTFDPADERSAVWSADGRRVIYYKGGDLFARASDFGGAEAPVLTNGRSKDPQQVSADGTRLLYRQSGAGNDLWQMSLVGEPAPAVVVNSPFDENYGNYSPDGRSVVFVSNESGRPEVYVLSLDGSGGRTIISSDGGMFPRWRHDGREIVYQRPDQTVMAVSVSGSGASLKAGTPSPLFRVATQPGAGNPFDVSADGQHFLVNTMLPARMPPSLTVIVNWPTLAAQQQSPQP